MTQKSKETHRKKKPETALFPQAALPLESVVDALISGPNGADRVRADVIQALTSHGDFSGFDDAYLRRLAAKNYFPAPVRAKFDLQLTLRGLFRYLRERAETSAATLPRFDTMEACEGAGYFSKSFLQTLKAAGLPGFENTRVDLDKIIRALEKWFSSAPEDDRNLLSLEGVRSFQEMREKYQAKSAKVEYETTQGQRIEKAVAVDCLRVNQSIHHGSYDRLIEELPAQLAGRDAAFIRAKLTAVLDATRKAEENEIVALEQQNKNAIESVANEK